MIHQLIIFCILSVPLIWISSPSLYRPASHGFARFFAFEIILALFVLNARHWFDSPLFGLQQSASWSFLMAALILVVWGVVLLRRVGGGLSGDERSAATTTSTISKKTTKEQAHESVTKEQVQESTPLFEWENTNRPVTTGVPRLSVSDSSAIRAICFLSRFIAKTIGFIQRFKL